MTDRQEIKQWFKDLLRPTPTHEHNHGAQPTTAAQQPISRRDAVKATTTAAAVLAGGLLQTHCSHAQSDTKGEAANLNWEEYFKKNYRLMTPEERQATVTRLTRLAKINQGLNVDISTKAPNPGVLFGYAFNISKCKGYMDCVKACIQENNLDRKSEMQYIRIFEIENGQSTLTSANSNFYHEVPANGHYYMGTQCFHCENPPCVDVCPVGATWKEPDGIVVVDYDWCIGCRYCEAACPYFGRRFNWNQPEIPTREINQNQHYLGNRTRKKGVMEKCTFCIQRSRTGQLPACVEACPTGARVFGNLLDPDSEIRYVLANKKVFRLKEELGTEPKFWYFTD